MVSTQIITPAVWTETGRNLATASSFEIPSTTAEIKRNAQGSPQADAARWLAQAGTGGVATSAVSNIGVNGAPVMEMTWTTQPTAGTPRIYTGAPVASRAVVTPSSQTPWSLDVSAVGVTVRIFADFYTAAGTFVTSAALTPGYQAVSTDPGKPTRIGGVFAIPATAERMILDVRTEVSQALPGRKITASRVAIGMPGFEYADGGYSADPDLTPSWAGTVNESVSILTGTLAATPITGSAWSSDGTDFCIQSTRWARSGTRSARMISNSATGSYRYILINALPAGTYTAVVPVHLEASQAAPGTNARTIEYRVDNVTQVISAPFPNEAGDHEVRLTFTKTTTAGTHVLLINQRVPRGDADLWLDDVTLAAGAYTGPAFSGDTYSTDRKRYRWLDAPGNSISVQEVMTAPEVVAPVYEEVTLTSPDDSITFRALPEFGGFVYNNPTLQRWYAPAEIDPDEDDRPNANGAFGLGQIYTKAHRPLLVGQYYGASSIESKAQRARLVAMYNEGNPITMSVKDETGAVTTRTVWLVDYDAPFAADFSHFTFDIDFIAPDPLRYGPTVSDSDGMPTQGSGLVWDLGTAPSGLFFDWGTSGNPGQIELTNAGGATSYPGIEVGGAGALGTGFRVTEIETGRELTFNRSTESGDTVIFDSRTQRATLNGGDVTGLMSSREWFAIPKGSTRRYQITPLGSVSGSPTINGYIGSAWL